MTLCPCVTAFLDAQYENAKCCAVARCAHVYFLCLCEKEWRRGVWHFFALFPIVRYFAKKESICIWKIGDFLLSLQP